MNADYFSSSYKSITLSVENEVNPFGAHNQYARIIARIIVFDDGTEN